jgi:hypothetical protein
VKKKIRSAWVAAADARLERIKLIGAQLAPSAVNSVEHRRLTAALRIEAAIYRKSLDTEQAAAVHDGSVRRRCRPTRA